MEPDNVLDKLYELVRDGNRYVLGLGLVRNIVQVIQEARDIVQVIQLVRDGNRYVLGLGLEIGARQCP